MKPKCRLARLKLIGSYSCGYLCNPTRERRLDCLSKPLVLLLCSLSSASNNYVIGQLPSLSLLDGLYRQRYFAVDGFGNSIHAGVPGTSVVTVGLPSEPFHC